MAARAAIRTLGAGQPAASRPSESIHAASTAAAAASTAAAAERIHAAALLLASPAPASGHGYVGPAGPGSACLRMQELPQALITECTFELLYVKKNCGHSSSLKLRPIHTPSYA